MFRFLKRNDSEVITPEVVDSVQHSYGSCFMYGGISTFCFYPNIVSFDAVKIGRNELFVACPPGQLNNPEVTITRPYCVPALCLWYSHSQYVGRGQSV